MRRTFVILVSCVLLTACGGGGGGSGGSIGDSDLVKQQDAADDVARKAVTALVTDLGAVPPGESLGRGLYAGCDGGDPDQASYFVDTFVTYDVRPAEQAADEVLRSLDGAGLDPELDAKTDEISAAKGDVTVDVTSQEKNGGSAGQNIFVSTGCLAIGKKAIADFNAANGRDVLR